MTLLETPINKEMTVEELASKVQYSAVLGKLPPQTTKNGQPFVKRNNSEDFSFHGQAEKMLKSLNHTVLLEAKLFWRFLGFIADKGFLDKSFGSQYYDIFLTTWRVQDEKSEDVIVAIGGVQEMSKIDRRGHTPYICYMQMKKEDVSSLLSLIEKDPMRLEHFYQAVFSGLDSEQDKDTGLRRIKTDKVVMIDIQTLTTLPKDEQQFLYPSTVVSIIKNNKTLTLSSKVGARNFW